MFFGGLECFSHSFAYAAHCLFLRNVWIRTQRAAVMEEIWSNRTYGALAQSSLLSTCVVFWSHRCRIVEYTTVMFSPERMYITLAVHARHILACRGTNVYGDLIKLLAFMSLFHFFFHNNFTLLITDSKVELQKSLKWSYIYLCLASHHYLLYFVRWVHWCQVLTISVKQLFSTVNREL